MNSLLFDSRQPCNCCGALVSPTAVDAAGVCDDCAAPTGLPTDIAPPVALGGEA